MGELALPLDSPRLVVLNPWDKRIGPNRYLASLLAADRSLASNATVLLAEEGEAADEYRALGCTVELWPAARLVHVGPTLRNLVTLLRVHSLDAWRLSRRLRQLEAELVISNSENVWLGGLAARLARVPHLQVFHALTLEHHWGGHPKLIRLYLRFLSTSSTRFIAVSATVAAMLQRYGISDKRVRVVPNALDIRAIEATSRAALSPELEQAIGARSPVLVTLGRMSSIKGHDLLVEALVRVREKYPDVICICAGRVGSDEGVDDTRLFFRNLKSRIHQLGLERNILFPGEIDCTPALLSRADIYVQPSRSESFCRAVVEAMVCGTPVAAFRVGGLPEVAGDGAILVDPLDVPGLADSILGLLGEESRRSELARFARRAAARFDVEGIAPIFRELVVSSAKRNPDGAG